MADIRVFPRGTVIFRQGDPGDCLYCIQSGRVGVFDDYGGPTEKKLADLVTGDLFGEMSLLDHAARSATVVTLEDETALQRISEDDFYAFFENSPETVFDLTKQMCHRLRMTTRSYADACHTVYETVEAEKASQDKSDSLLDRIRELRLAYLASIK